MPPRTRLTLVLAGLLVALNVFDIVVHVATDQVEPLRIAGNVVVLVASLALLFVASARRAWVPAVAGGVSLALNAVFIALNGIGVAGAVLVAVTTVLCIALAVILARGSRSS